MEVTELSRWKSTRFRAKFTRAKGAPIKADSGWVWLYWSPEGGGFYQLSEKPVGFHVEHNQLPDDPAAAFSYAVPWWYEVDLGTIERADVEKVMTEHASDYQKI